MSAPLVTAISCGPIVFAIPDLAGKVAVIVVSLVTEQLATAMPPKVTSPGHTTPVPVVNPEPVMVIVVPPAAVPAAGETELRVGAAAWAAKGTTVARVNAEIRVTHVVF